MRDVHSAAGFSAQTQKSAQIISASFDLAGNLLGITANRAFKNAQGETGRSRFNTCKYCQAIALRATRRLGNGKLGIE
jgi:hypothetical protein